MVAQKYQFIREQSRPGHSRPKACGRPTVKPVQAQGRPTAKSYKNLRSSNRLNSPVPKAVRPPSRPETCGRPTDSRPKRLFLILHKTGLFTYSIPQYLSRPTYSRPKRVSTILLTRFPLLFTSISRFLKSIPHKVTLNFQLN